MVQLSLDSKYCAKGYSELEIDLATVVYELGGNHGLTALHNSPFAFPSRNTLVECRSKYKVNITVGKLRLLDILNNIKIMSMIFVLERNRVRLHFRWMKLQATATFAI